MVMRACSRNVRSPWAAISCVGRALSLSCFQEDPNEQLEGVHKVSRSMFRKAGNRSGLVLGAVTLLSLGLTACATSSDQRSARLQDDANTCAAFGAEFGSKAYTECMLAQQQRRDAKRRESLERTALTSQIARDAQIMAERARKQRCERNPDRRECR